MSTFSCRRCRSSAAGLGLPFLIGRRGYLQTPEHVLVADLYPHLPDIEALDFVSIMVLRAEFATRASSTMRSPRRCETAQDTGCSYVLCHLWAARVLRLVLK